MEFSRIRGEALIREKGCPEIKGEPEISPAFSTWGLRCHKMASPKSPVAELGAFC